MTAVLEVRDLCKVFPIRGAGGRLEQLTAVDHVSFSIAPRGSLAVVGESGSGKTTVGRIIAGLETATAGSVLVDGELRMSTRIGRRFSGRDARQVQMVFQDPYASLDPHQTVGATLMEVLRHHFPGRRGEYGQRVQELLEQVGLDARHAEVRAHRLSGGERQRVAVARALAVRPRLLILDEPVSSLDVSIQAQVLNLLADLRQSIDVAFLFVSHDLGVVRYVSDDCIVMHRGRIEESGNTGSVLDNPQAEYTQQLLSAIPRPGWHPQRRLPARQMADGGSL